MRFYLTNIVVLVLNNENLHNIILFRIVSFNPNTTATELKLLIFSAVISKLY